MVCVFSVEWCWNLPPVSVRVDYFVRSYASTTVIEYRNVCFIFRSHTPAVRGCSPGSGMRRVVFCSQPCIYAFCWKHATSASKLCHPHYRRHQCDLNSFKLYRVAILTQDSSGILSLTHNCYQLNSRRSHVFPPPLQSPPPTTMT